MASGRMMHQLQARLESRREVGGSMWVLAFAAAAIAADAEPGQFVNLLLRPGPLLRRPFSVYRAERGQVEVLVRDVGVGTAQLVGMREGDSLSMLGPLGHGFGLDPEGGPVALVSGGLGVAPMPLAAARARDLGLDVHWVHGARTASELCTEWQGDSVHWATDDGSQGFSGSALDAIPAVAGQVLACGPNPMLAALARKRPDAQVAVEAYMACGTGVCLGCAVPRTEGRYDRACTEGPVYQADSIRWEDLPPSLPYRAGS
ncbi:MAG: FAD-binding oxidoreductase [Candidatus Dormibacteraceae bacterium]